MSAAERPITNAMTRALQQRPLELGFGILLVVLGIQTLLKRQSEWNEVFVDAGRRLIAGQDIYSDNSAYLYPPFMALVAAPFSFLPPTLSRLGWFAASAVSMIVMLRAAWSIAGGPPASQFKDWERREKVAALLGIGCGLTFTLNAFAHQQVDVVIGALIVVGCVRLLAAHNAAAAAWFGFAASCKASPLLWSPYLVLRGRFVAAILVVVVAIGVNLLPDLIASAPQGGTWLERWLTRYVLPSQSLQSALGTWGTDPIYNQSLGGTVQRWVNSALVARDGKLVTVMRPVVDAVTLKAIYYSVLAAMIAISVATAVRAAASSRVPSQLPPIVFELGLVVTVTLLASPMSGSAHFGPLVLPGFCLARFALLNGDRLIGALVATAAVLAVLCNRDLVGYISYNWLLWGGAITITTLLLWLGCILALARGRTDGARV